MKLPDSYIEVDVAAQRLRLWQQGVMQREYVVSTATNGTGQQSGSECTPLGQHVVRAKIGQHQPENAVFVARRATGEIYSDELAAAQPQRDWILTRILWLSGLEVGKNRLGQVDTMRRYIYIHGAPETSAFGTPCSHGCIRMKNKDIMELFEQVAVGSMVNIHE